MAQQSGEPRILRSQIANGLNLIKEEVDHYKNFEFLDQVNTYTVSAFLS